MKKVLILFTVLTACVQQPTQVVSKNAMPTQQIDSSVSNSAISGLWIDVRTAEEYAEGHLQNAINIPVEQIAKKIETVQPDKNTPIHVYCRSGRRSEVALRELRKLGYTNVTNQGAYQDLLHKGLK